MRTRSVVALSATLALLGSGSALGAAGDPQDDPAAGAASSTLTLLGVGLGGESVSVLELALRSDTLSGSPATSFAVTPVTLGGTPYGRQSLSSRSAALPAVDTTTLAPAALSGLAAARSPLVDVTVDGGSSRAGTTSLGAISVLGMPLALDGTVAISSTVDSAGASGGKTLTVTRLALPSIADLLAALGLDVRELPAGSLADLLSGLDLDSPLTATALGELEKALAPVQPQVDQAEALVAQAGAQVEAAVAQVEAARAALPPATTTLNDATRALTGTVGLARRGSLLGLDPLPTVEPVTTVLEPVEPLPAPVALVQDTLPPVVAEPVGTVEDALDTVTEPVVAPVVEAVTETVLLPAPDLTSVSDALQPAADAYTQAKTAYDAALQAVRDAEAVLAAAHALLADAVAKVTALLAPYQGQVDALVGAVVDVLDATPLLSLDRLEVTTRSSVTSAGAGGQSAEIVDGQVRGLRVLGTDVLDSALGTSQVEVLDLAGPLEAKVDDAISDLTGTLSTVLSQVPGLPTLEVPAPKVDLLTQATSTDVVDGFGVAGSALRAVTVSWPGLKVPAAAALPGAATLPAVAGAPALPALRRASLVTGAGDVLSQPLTLSLVTLEDRARYRPAQLSLQPGTGAPTTGAPTTGGPTTGAPTTGAPTTGTPDTSAPPTAGTSTTGTPDPAAPPNVATGQQLPRTGLDSDPSALALLLIAGALGLHRRSRTA